MRNTVTSSSGAGACEVRTSTQVDAYLNELMASVEQLGISLDRHGAKIGPVLQPACPGDPSIKEPPEETVCDVANRIRQSVRRINQINRGLNDLTDRTEA